LRAYRRGYVAAGILIIIASFPSRKANEEKNSGSLSHYSETVDAFLSHYYPSMENALLPASVSATIIDAVNNAKSSSESLYRYPVGEDSKCLAASKVI
jgi:hypothetical protein